MFCLSGNEFSKSLLEIMEDSSRECQKLIGDIGQLLETDISTEPQLAHSRILYLLQISQNAKVSLNLLLQSTQRSNAKSLTTQKPSRGATHV